MNNLELKRLIAEYQNYNMKAFILIHNNFSKLIYYYANRIGDDDAVQELNLFLVELLFKIDLEKFKDNDAFDLKNYIVACIRNQYIMFSQKKE